MATQAKPFITPEQYLEIERDAAIKSEYYNGEMFAMSGGSRQHSGISLNVGGFLNTRIRAGCRAFNSDMRVRVGATGLYTYPDISVACNPVFDDKIVDTLLNPALIIEILSPSTEKYDRTAKFDHYGRLESLREYLLIWQDQPRLQLFTRQQDGSWRLDEVNSMDTSIALSVVDTPLPMAEIYRGIELPETPPPLPR